MNPRYLIPALIWSLLIFWIISLPGSSIPKTPLLQLPHFDKFVHVSIFMVFAFLLAFGIDKQEVKGIQRNIYTITIAICVIYSTGTEWLQHNYVPGRHGDFWDILANLAGSLTGLMIYLHRISLLSFFWKR